MDEKVKRLIEASNAVLEAGSYDDAGDFVIPHSEWDGVADPPDISDPPALVELGEAVAAFSVEAR